MARLTLVDLQKQLEAQQLELDEFKKSKKDAELYQLQRSSMEAAGTLSEKYRYVHVRSFASPEEHKRGSELQNARWNHMRPDSTLVCAMGFHWSKEGLAWQKVCDMIEFTQERGYYVALSELQDRCYEPYDALGTMRNEAILMAQNEGFERLLYIDNDVLPEPDCLFRLLQHEHSIVVPFMAEPGTGRQLSSPAIGINSGIQPAKWSVLSMMLFKTSVFNCTGPNFWRDAIGADEGFHFQLLWHFGHRPWVDSGIQLVTAGGPTYPLSTNRLTKPERDELWEKRNEKRNLPPDRSPKDPDGKNVLPNGEYFPWHPDAASQQASENGNKAWSEGNPDDWEAMVNDGETPAEASDDEIEEAFSELE